MKKVWTINYGTGAGNKTIEGTLDDAKALADEGACYTQTSITIYDGETPVATRKWYGLDFEQCRGDYDTEDPDVITIGSSGFYDEWMDL